MIPAEIEQIQIGISWWNKAKIIRLGNVFRLNQSLNLIRSSFHPFLHSTLHQTPEELNGITPTTSLRT